MGILELDFSRFPGFHIFFFPAFLLSSFVFLFPQLTQS